eukprot:TRINITY_DN17073_c0_g1_i1.p1 TRINITY_DN17073_c0_g1~~TRINITY_DN17073_c0_g1_i1.p1  ORF type:complete len:713 (+),score=117.55 TRINITY_DN17073_c0_g1_i1:96-2234(+)
MRDRDSDLYSRVYRSHEERQSERRADDSGASAKRQARLPDAGYDRRRSLSRHRDRRRGFSKDRDTSDIRDRDFRDDRDRDRDRSSREQGRYDIRDRVSRDERRRDRDQPSRENGRSDLREHGFRDDRERDRDRLLREQGRQELREEQRERRERERVERKPSAVFEVTGLPEQGVITEQRLEAVAWEQAVAAGCSMPNRVQLEPEGKAIIEFPHKDAAKMFKEHTDGVFEVDGVKLSLRYKHLPGELSRSRSRERELHEPTMTIIVKGISTTTGEEAVCAAFQPFAVVKDIRHFAVRGFAFVQFHSVEDASLALKRFEKEGRCLIDGLRVSANFAKQKEDMGPREIGSLAERNFLQKQAIASAEVSAEMEKLQQQQLQNENTNKALSGVNGSMWANYMQSVAQTETVQSSNTFKYDKESGFYKDSKAELFYDPNTTYFFTLNFKKYFVYDHDEKMLCLVDSEGKKVDGGERRPLPSQVSNASNDSKHSTKPRSRSIRRLRSRSRSRQGTKARSRSRRRLRSRSRSRRRPSSKSLERKNRTQDRDRERGKEQELGSQRAKGHEIGQPETVKDGKHQPIHFPGGDPLAKLAPAAVKPEVQVPAPKKKKKPQDTVLGLALLPENRPVRLQKPGPVTVFKAPRPGPVTLLGQQQFFKPAEIFPPPPPNTDSAYNAPPIVDWICEVCMRKFASEAALQKHEQLSELHKQNLMKLGVAV